MRSRSRIAPSATTPSARSCQSLRVFMVPGARVGIGVVGFDDQDAPSSAERHRAIFRRAGATPCQLQNVRPGWQEAQGVSPADEPPAWCHRPNVVHETTLPAHGGEPLTTCRCREPVRSALGSRGGVLPENFQVRIWDVCLRLHAAACLRGDAGQPSHVGLADL